MAMSMRELSCDSVAAALLFPNGTQNPILTRNRPRRILMRLRHCAVALALLLAPALAAPASAQAPAGQNWPTRTVKFIVTLGPGSGSDIGGRLLADRLTKKWG